MFTWMFAIIAAGWTPSVVDGKVSPTLLSELEEVVAHCPHSHGDWVVRVTDTGQVKLGPVAGADSDNAALESCLQAGLAARPVPGPVILRLSFKDPRTTTWEAAAVQGLNQQVGPERSGSCSTLRWRIGPGGVLSEPQLMQSSGSEDLDRRALSAAQAPQRALPPVPQDLQALYGEHVDLCVGGVAI